jgi:PD-(D/E)XK nuclease superfamily protein
MAKVRSSLIGDVQKDLVFTGPALYLDGGKRITTHSMLSTMRRCPNQARYKYAERLKVRFATKRDKPLKRGTWFHALLEEYYAGRSWKAMHARYTLNYQSLFDEEKEALGDLPTELHDMMRSYLWHYGADKDDPFHGTRTIGTEVTLECPWPDSKDGLDLYRCRVDRIYEDEWGLWAEDTKTNRTLPDHNYRMLDAASPLYIWCLRENGYPVNGFVWNYVRAKTPTKPQLAYAGTTRQRLSTKAIDTDYPTMVRGLRELGLNPGDYKDILRPLYDHRYRHGEVQTSTFFRRDTLEKDDGMIARAVASGMRTRDWMHGYDWTDPDSTERCIDRTCTSMCSFTNLCITELSGGDAKTLRKRLFRVGDPLDYYQDTPDPEVIEVS